MVDGALHLVEPWEGGSPELWDLALECKAWSCGAWKFPVGKLENFKNLMEIDGTNGIFTYMNGWCLRLTHVGNYTSSIHGFYGVMGCFVFQVLYTPFLLHIPSSNVRAKVPVESWEGWKLHGFFADGPWRNQKSFSKINEGAATTTQNNHCIVLNMWVTMSVPVTMMSSKPAPEIFQKHCQSI